MFCRMKFVMAFSIFSVRSCYANDNGITHRVNAADILNPVPKNESYVAVDFSVEENGSAASEATKAKAGIDALKLITKPGSDELLKTAISG